MADIVPDPVVAEVPVVLVVELVAALIDYDPAADFRLLRAARAIANNVVARA
jgi:hypothetical protein